MSYSATGETGPLNTFVTVNGVRYFDPLTQTRILAALASMSPSMATAVEMPTVDAAGATVTVTPGLIPMLPSAVTMLQSLVQVGNAILAPDNFSENTAQALRVVMDQTALPAHTDPAKGGTYAVLLAPAGAPVPGLPLPGVPIPGVPLPGVPATPPPKPAAAPPPPPSVGAQISAMSLGAKVGIALGGVVAIAFLASVFKGKS